MRDLKYGWGCELIHGKQNISPRKQSWVAENENKSQFQSKPKLLNKNMVRKTKVAETKNVAENSIPGNKIELPWYSWAWAHCVHTHFSSRETAQHYFNPNYLVVGSIILTIAVQI